MQAVSRKGVLIAVSAGRKRTNHELLSSDSHVAVVARTYSRRGSGRRVVSDGCKGRTQSLEVIRNLRSSLHASLACT
jgi:hypothetical protein